MNQFRYGEDQLTASIALGLARKEIQGVLSPATIQKVQQSAAAVAEIAAGERIVYGINTGFGSLCDTAISHADLEALQRNLVCSHACGMGDQVSKEMVRLMLVLKAKSLSYGHSGVQLQTVELLLELYNRDILPVVYEQGSLGASGDLSPLSHMCLPLIGEGEVQYKGKKCTAKEALKAEGLSAIELQSKEGLALINGTQFMLAHAVCALIKTDRLFGSALAISALSIEAFDARPEPFLDLTHQVRNQSGQRVVAQALRKLLEGSEMQTQKKKHVQDPYSLRCIPQVHGASRNAWLHLKQLTEIELNAVTDNPILIANKEAISGGNFHGQPLALPLDYACFAAAELGNISDRRSYLLLEGKWGLPTLLMEKVGLNSGFMIPQYTTAALVTENKTLCFPASVDSIPTSLGQEDHVSMGSISARKFNTILDNLEYILSIELLLAAQAIEFRRPLKSSDLVELIYQEVRKSVSFAKEDRIFSLDIEKVVQVVRSSSLLEGIQKNAVQLGIQLNKNYSEFDC